jgi:hypothetical protein
MFCLIVINLIKRMSIGIPFENSFFQKCAGHEILMPRGTRPVGLASPSRLAPFILRLVPPVPV